MSDIKVIGFDLDQTLYPKSPLIDERIQSYLYQKIAERRQVSLVEAEQLFKDRYRAGAGMSGGETLLDLGLPDSTNLIQEALERADIASILFPDEETTALLHKLRDQFVGMDLITGSDTRNTEKKLTALGLSFDSFTHVITDNEAAKSTGEAYRLWLSFYPQLAPNQFLYIGDRIHSDHEIPSELGITTALVYVKTPDVNVSCKQYSDFKSCVSTLVT